MTRDAIMRILVNDPACAGRVTTGAVTAIAALVESSSFNAGIEKAADVAEKRFADKDWRADYRIASRDIAAAIRALKQEG